jgi:hypothetical protein
MGGGVYAYYNSSIDITNGIVANNGATSTYMTGYSYGSYGGGLAMNGQTDLVLTNVDVTGNWLSSDTDAYGGGMYLSYYLDVTITNANVVDNTVTASSTGTGGAVAAYASYYLYSFDVTYSDFYDNSSDEFYNVSSPVGSNGNIAKDPQYTDTTAADGADWDLALQSSSPCIDAGDSSISDVDGTRSDMGAYGGPSGAW